MSITQYAVGGNGSQPTAEQVRAGLSRFVIHDIDNDTSEMTSGWTPFATPYSTDFDSAPFFFGTYFVFSLRIDKKRISPAMIQKQMAAARQARRGDPSPAIMAPGEKKRLKEAIVDALCQRIPATPNVYDVVWNVEKKRLFFSSNLKAANEALESLFYKTFKLTLIRLFPYTLAELFSGLSDTQKDRLSKLAAKPLT